jgi:hypothetical protein
MVIRNDSHKRVGNERQLACSDCGHGQVRHAEFGGKSEQIDSPDARWKVGKISNSGGERV